MSDDTKTLKLTVGEILRSALQGTNPRYCAGHFTRWGHVEADINAAIDADRDALAERCERLREALRELHNRLSRRDVFVATCEGVTYKGWLLNIVNAALTEKEGE